jgi:DNA polymerase III subunit gamma/tau
MLMNTSAHTTLYRKYRPATFAEVQGQDRVISLLQTQITQGTVGHAYIFAGGRGIGKTSIARIFAKELSIEPHDIAELDAASNNSVDDVRALNEEVSVMPFTSTRKMYILDEAHMMTRQAWNALLKTLEEPPAHVIFVMCTTELEKIPTTILSRSEVHMFLRPSPIILSAHIQNVAQFEGVHIEPDAAETLALVADGSFRDALSHLQKCLSLTTNGILEREHVERVTGAPARTQLLKLLTAIEIKDVETAIALVQDMRILSLNSSLTYVMLLDLVRAVLLARVAPQAARIELEQHFSPESWKSIGVLASAGAQGLSSLHMRKLLELAPHMQAASDPFSVLDLFIFETCGTV